MQRYIVYLSIFTAVCVASACEKSYLYEYFITNKTNYAIDLFFFTKYNKGVQAVLTDSIKMGANTNYAISSQPEAGDPINISCVAKALGGYSDSIVARIDSSRTLRKNLQIDDNWETTKNTKDNTYTCTFIINASDVQ